MEGGFTFGSFGEEIEPEPLVEEGEYSFLDNDDLVVPSESNVVDSNYMDYLDHGYTASDSYAMQNEAVSAGYTPPNEEVGYVEYNLPTDTAVPQQDQLPIHHHQQQESHQKPPAQLIEHSNNNEFSHPQQQLPQDSAITDEPKLIISNSLPGAAAVDVYTTATSNHTDGFVLTVTPLRQGCGISINQQKHSSIYPTSESMTSVQHQIPFPHHALPNNNNTFYPPTPTSSSDSHQKQLTSTINNQQLTSEEYLKMFILNNLNREDLIQEQKSIHVTDEQRPAISTSSSQNSSAVPSDSSIQQRLGLNMPAVMSPVKKLEQKVCLKNLLYIYLHKQILRFIFEFPLTLLCVACKYK